MQQPNSPSPTGDPRPPSLLFSDNLANILTPKTHNSEQYAYMTSLAGVCRAFRDEVNSQTRNGNFIHPNFQEVIDAQADLHAPGTLRARILACGTREDQVEVLRETRQCIADGYLDEGFVQDIVAEIVLMLTQPDGSDEDIAYSHELLREVMTENMRMDCPIMQQQCFFCHILMAVKVFVHNETIAMNSLQIIVALLSPFAYDFLSDAGVGIILRVLDQFRGNIAVVFAGFKALLLYSNNLDSVAKLQRTTRHKAVNLILQIQGQYGFHYLHHQVNAKKGTEILALLIVVPDYRNDILEEMLVQFERYQVAHPTRENAMIHLNVLCMATDQLVDSDRNFGGDFPQMLQNSKILDLFPRNEFCAMTDHMYIHQMLHILKNLATLGVRHPPMIFRNSTKIYNMLLNGWDEAETPVDTLKMVQALIAFVGKIRNLEGGGVKQEIQATIVRMGIIPLIMERLARYRNQDRITPEHRALLAEMALLLYVLVLGNASHQKQLIESNGMNILLDIGVLKSTQSASQVESRTLYLVCYLLSQNYQHVLARDRHFVSRERQYSGGAVTTNFDRVLRVAVGRPNASAALRSMFSICCDQYCAQPTR